MYNKWKCLPEFHHIFILIDDDDGRTNETITDVSGGDTNDDESMEDDYSDDQTVDAASSDNQSDDDASSDVNIQDEEMSFDEDSDAVNWVRYPLSFLLFF